MTANSHRAGQRGAIVFSHANGFPAGTYRVLFDELRELSNLIGRPMPDIALLGTDIRQQPLPLTQPN